MYCVILFLLVVSFITGGQIQNQKQLSVDAIHMKLLQRSKRAGENCGGIPIRKEIRQLSYGEWKNFTDAMNTLKIRGDYDRLAAIHRGSLRINKTHAGPNFLGWHRIYLLYLQYDLQEINPCVSIPYWDSTLDYEIDDPTKSVLFTDAFFGNGKGKVITGPFANWITGLGISLMRNIGAKGTLIRKEYVDRVLSRQNHIEITDMTVPFYSIEEYHNGPHVWVDGQMVLLEEASEDPIFWMHHAFIDCWWQRFIEKNSNGRQEWAYHNYPAVTGLHAPDEPMDPFDHFSNNDGYQSYLYDNVYRCETFPSCNTNKTDCDSPYLECNTTSWRCVSKTAPFVLKKRRTRKNRNRNRGKHFRLTIPMGRKFKSFFRDRRDKGLPLPQATMSLSKSPDFRKLNLKAVERYIEQKVMQTIPKN